MNYYHCVIATALGVFWGSGLELPKFPIALQPTGRDLVFSGGTIQHLGYCYQYNSDPANHNSDPF